MKTLYVMAGLFAVWMPMAASANDLEWSAELGLNVAASSGAVETTANTAVELSYAGAFVGGEIETLFQDPTDKAEITLTLGYTFDIGADTALTASYSRIFLDNSGFSSHEIGAALDFPISSNVGGTFEIVHDLTASTTDYSLGAEFGLGNGFTAEALIGHDGTEVYGETGLSYDFNDTLSAGLVVELSQSASPVFNFGLTIGFGS